MSLIARVVSTGLGRIARITMTAQGTHEREHRVTRELSLQPREKLLREYHGSALCRRERSTTHKVDCPVGARSAIDGESALPSFRVA